MTKTLLLSVASLSLLAGAAQANTLDAVDANGSAQPIDDVILVEGRYLSLDKVNAVKAPTPIIDVPQSLSIVTRDQIEDQSFTSIGDIVRYTPGLAISQGEGHRDSIIFRGNQATADFFIDGLRDDVCVIGDQNAAFASVDHLVRLE